MRTELPVHFAPGLASCAMSVKRLRITTDKNGMNSMVENYEVTTQHFPTQTSKLF